MSSVFLLLFLAIGCHSVPIKEQPLTQLHGANDPSAQMDFWHTLATRPLTSNDDAFHGLLLFLDGQDPSTSYEDRVATLKSRELLPANFSSPGNEAVDRGTLAVAFVKTLNIRGGLTMSLLGPTPRYATRLLVFRGIYPETTPNQLVSGADFVGLIGRLEDYQRENVEKPAALLPGETTAAPPQVVLAPDLSFTLSENFRDQRIEGLIPSDSPDFSDPVYLMLQTQPATTAPATLPAISTDVIVDGVEGKFVQVRSGPDQPWQPAVVGQRYTVNCEFRTGPKSAVRFIIPPDQTWTLDRVSTLRVTDIIAQGRKLTTNVDLAYGRVRHDLEPISAAERGTDRSPYQVSETGIEHATTIRSPNSTLAVRGTRVALYDQPPFVPQAVSLVGNAQYQNARRQTISFGSQLTQTNRITSDDASSAENALSQTIVDPTIRAARTTEDAALLSTLVGRGSVITFDRGSGLSIVRGGIPPTDKQLIPALPGQLSFVLRWTGSADLNLSVANQANGRGEFVYPAAGLHTAPSGGTTRFDHQGGAHGGIEVVYWKGPAPTGFYSVGVQHVSGKKTNATVDVFKNGKRIDLVDLGANGGAGAIVKTFNTKVGPKQTSAVLVPVGVAPPPIVPEPPPGLPEQKSKKKAKKS